VFTSVQLSTAKQRRLKWINPNMITKDELLVINQIENYAIFTLDDYGQIASWNKGAQSLTGYEEEEVIGLPGSIIFTPEDVIRLEPEKEMREATKKGLVETRRLHIGKYGKCFWAESSLIPLRNNGEKITGFVKVLRAENNKDKIGEEKGRFFSHSIDLFCIVSFNGQIKCVNPAFIRALKTAGGEMPLTTIFDLIHPDDRAAVEVEFSKLITGQSINNVRHRFSFGNGTTKLFAWAFFPDLTEELAYGVGRDISDFKEEEHGPAEQNGENGYQPTEEFLAALSDDLKDPLNTIRDFAELIMRTHHLSQIAQIRWAAEIIYRHAKAQAELIENLLDNPRIKRTSVGTLE
jgi:PAS domain S-box-containing protein